MSWNRRDFLQWTAAGALTSCLAAPLLAEDKKPAGKGYGGFKMGLQSYSLRGFDVQTALDHTKTLGIKYWEAFPGHLPMSSLPAKIDEQKEMLKAAGVTLVAWGVTGFDENESKARSVFEYAKAMGMMSISADPKKNKETFDLLDKLVAEYDVAIAIHNHGPGAQYDKIQDALNWVKDRHPKIGACVDTGHYLRSDESPVEAIQKFGKRTFGVHFKDVKTTEKDGKKQKQFRILGEGDLDILGCMKVLKELNYSYGLSLEYEENPKNPLSDIEVCLKAVRDAADKM